MKTSRILANAMHALLGALLLAPVCWAEEAAVADKPVAFASQNAASAGHLAQLVIGLMIVVAGILARAWVLRRMNLVNSGVGGALRVLGGVSVGQRERIVLLQVGEQQMLIGVAPGSVRTLHVLEEPIQAPEGHVRKVEGAFAQQLSMMLKGKGGAA